MSIQPIILKQACSYKFIIHKKLELTGDNNIQYILVGPADKKYLLNGEFYTHYNLKIGQEINCRVDKINCSGQIFLEPDHPHYNIGESYMFPVKELRTGLDPWGKEQHSAVVIDKNNIVWNCVINRQTRIEPGKTEIECVVSKIKKGSIFLMLKDYVDDMSKLLDGEFYKFKVIGERIINDKEYIILEDPFSIKHKIIKEYYSHFNYTIGQLITARIKDRWPDMSYKIEPNNPRYLIGGIYKFKVIRLDLVFNAIGEVIGVFQLEDSYGLETPVVAMNWQVNSPKYHPEEIRCRVVNYKKGKLLLENIEEYPE